MVQDIECVFDFIVANSGCASFGWTKPLEREWGGGGRGREGGKGRGRRMSVFAFRQ